MSSRSGSRRSNSRGRVDWDNMSTGMQPDFSAISSIGSTGSSRSGSSRRGSSRSGSSQRSVSSGAIQQRLREEEYYLQLEHEKGVRVCYTGTFLTQGRRDKHGTGTYTIKEFLKLATDKFNQPGPEPMPQPQYDSEYRTLTDLNELLDYFRTVGEFGRVVTSFCSDKQHGDRALGLPSCKDCEDEMKDGAGPDLYTTQAREDARIRSSRRRRRQSRRRRERESIRRVRSAARRGSVGAREELTRRLARRERRRARRATRRRS